MDVFFFSLLWKCIKQVDQGESGTALPHMHTPVALYNLNPGLSLIITQ